MFELGAIVKVRSGGYSASGGEGYTGRIVGLPKGQVLRDPIYKIKAIKINSANPNWYFRKAGSIYEVHTAHISLESPLVALGAVAKEEAHSNEY